MSGSTPTISSMTNPWIDPQRSSAIWSGAPSKMPAGGRDAPDAERAGALLRQQLAGRLEDPLALFVPGPCHPSSSLPAHAVEVRDDHDVLEETRELAEAS